MIEGIEGLARNRQPVLLLSLAAIFAAALAWVIGGAGMGMDTWDMTRMALFPHSLGGEVDAGLAMPGWSLGHLGLATLMWWAMMIGMMLPSALPMILLHARVSVRGASRGHPMQAAPGCFAAGYLTVWLGFSLVAALLQFGLVQGRFISGMMLWSNSRWLSAALLALAAVYQFSALKHRCLAECRAPAEFLARHWRNGAGGAFVMGLRHGAFCTGCCWALMLLLFVGGVMNLLWIAALAAIVLVEKLAPSGALLGRIGGVLLLTWAGATLVV
ncbi:hypothetical protein DEA8626_03413 [Defluviimonas aquaemixtae]|uniref:Metal-binding integral membrane protein n=1 Tax=Albidovulum aquaemixtae TaxID=1542388 RepID=A0A2R8BLR3_9RHOB|nr:DUF2182 domain-containing protein [Defluviimonas aquaemixtae]SPH24362.1 hypothetical protein DEA8626_03413 [Defluviimonas aquaemixtae]